MNWTQIHVNYYNKRPNIRPSASILKNPVSWHKHQSKPSLYSLHTKLPDNRRLFFLRIFYWIVVVCFLSLFFFFRFKDHSDIFILFLFLGMTKLPQPCPSLPVSNRVVKELLFFELCDNIKAAGQYKAFGFWTHVEMVTSKLLKN